MNQPSAIDTEVQALSKQYGLSAEQTALVSELLAMVRQGFPVATLENTEPSVHYLPQGGNLL